MSSPTISHVVSLKESTMISHEIADDQPCRLFQSTLTISHVVSFNQSMMISHVIADDQPCRLFQSINVDQPCHRRRSAMSSVSIDQR
ncbi:hypothetical protein RHMOL_Rhmol11G0049800 [Rhododendron molle]|uniref:Uncharacterized protein n=1 Tax=Rhododendron molle TaxID=49168 RepID=A0ACC0LNZ9_RHOML|nr:hypothetical protein RHMOL_Rhmol11G0049800 [Rhododendron molle]